MDIARLVVEFRVWLDAARLSFLLTTHIGIAAMLTYWNSRLSCPEKSTSYYWHWFLLYWIYSYSTRRWWHMPITGHVYFTHQLGRSCLPWVISWSNCKRLYSINYSCAICRLPMWTGILAIQTPRLVATSRKAAARWGESNYSRFRVANDVATRRYRPPAPFAVVYLWICYWLAQQSRPHVTSILASIQFSCSELF